MPHSVVHWLLFALTPTMISALQAQAPTIPTCSGPLAEGMAFLQATGRVAATVSPAAIPSWTLS